MGLLPISRGRISVNNRDFTNKPAEFRAQSGIAYVPQGRGIFPHLTVEENLVVAINSVKSDRRKIPHRVFDFFPLLTKRLNTQGGNLSGGQQQQLAIARALAINPTVLILDEPSEGLQPSIVQQIGDVILELVSNESLTVLLVEQKISFAMRVAQEFRLMDRGRVVSSGLMPNLSEQLIKKHLLI